MEYGYWTFGGRNGLQGASSTLTTLPDGRDVLVKDSQNPAVLEDPVILLGLSKSVRARYDFERLYPLLDQDSQYRLAVLIENNPRCRSMVLYEQTFCDRLQNREVSSGVHLRLPSS